MTQEKVYHYYLVSDTRNLKSPVDFFQIHPEAEIPAQLRFTFSDQGITPESGVMIFELPTGRSSVSDGTQIPFPSDNGQYNLRISNFENVYIWTTKHDPNKWRRIQSHHRFSGDFRP